MAVTEDRKFTKKQVYELLEGIKGKTLGEVDRSGQFMRTLKSDKITGIAGDVIEQSVFGYKRDSNQECDIEIEGVLTELKTTGVRIPKEDLKKIKGKKNLDNLLKSNKELKVFAIHHSDLKKFCEEAKHYGVLYSVLKEKNNTDGIVDIMVKAEDASKISRMVDKFDLATIDTKAIRESVLSQKDIKPMSDEEHDALLSKLMDEKSNPNKARTSKDGTPFEPSSKTLKRESKKKTVERKKSTVTMDRPSVRQELKDIKQEQLKSSAPKYPVRKKSKNKVR